MKIPSHVLIFVSYSPLVYFWLTIVSVRNIWNSNFDVNIVGDVFYMLKKQISLMFVHSQSLLLFFVSISFFVHFFPANN